MASVKRALISVSDKTGLTDLAHCLARYGCEILSTGGTAKTLRDCGIRVIEVADYTGFPEMLDGRVKTLHPRIHGGILARRDQPTHVRAMTEHDIPPIDLVVVNLYPFAQTVARGARLDGAIENIDIGGPAMVRSAAKNYRDVAVVTDPADYPRIIEELDASEGAIGLKLRFALAKKAFSHTAAYDSAISNYLTSLDDQDEPGAFPQRLNLNFERVQTLRYGENPHQNAAFYRDVEVLPGSLASCRQVQGKELSYNNIADADAAWECVKTFEQVACVIVKHANPCGVAIAESITEAYQRAFATDPTSAFGGIIAMNRPLDAAAAEAVSAQFVEVLIAPSITTEALAVLARKPNIRVLEIALAEGANRWDFKRVGGGLLLQSPDIAPINAADLHCVTRRKPSPHELADLVFAWRVAKFVKSNAIVYCGDGRTLGVGAGQMSRVDSARIAASKAVNAGLSLHGSVVASDAFFPFRDGIDVLAEAGARAVVQPGGSMRDEEVIAAADEHGLAMVFTGIRHFRH
ncbi:MAG: bifunctional phosphoribosylaminoimidazolecarboxamide formyltransferase/IMP cyclohydrolase PurH [Betaproteobacteria bacterium]|nr:MAG: bifunctional phosphoribosylaminoimidazolecarboxamide formyltransferase/IMP cyclohydrolase PurH [Betaproteobacteria bacterium]